MPDVIRFEAVLGAKNRLCLPLNISDATLEPLLKTSLFGQCGYEVRMSLSDQSFVIIENGAT